MNSLVQSASEASPSTAIPDAAEAESPPDRNSDAQSPDRANAATPGAVRVTHDDSHVELTLRCVQTQYRLGSLYKVLE